MNATDWPTEGLERLGQCPVCASGARELLHRSLSDTLFGAPGAWHCWSCRTCGCCYLDPRPTRDSISLAYSRYYTHEIQPGELPQVAPLRRPVSMVKDLLRRRYIQERYALGSRIPVATQLLKIAPLHAAVIDRLMRHLPRPWGRARLLDVGCGSGSFLAWSRFAGWNSEGQDVDSKAVAEARRLGFTVHEGQLGDLVGTARYEQVTANHVIEHVHDPFVFLEDVRRLLVPGGRLWIESPNVGSVGHRLFGRAWRGLEPPRHLQLLTHAALERLCRDAGFKEVAIAPWWPDWRGTFPASSALAEREGMAMPQQPDSRQQNEGGRLHPHAREFVTLVARVGP